MLVIAILCLNINWSSRFFKLDGGKCSIVILLWKVRYISFLMCSDLNFDN